MQRKAVNEIIHGISSIFVFFGNAYALKYFENIHQCQWINTCLSKYKSCSGALAAQLIFGAIEAKWKTSGIQSINGLK